MHKAVDGDGALLACRNGVDGEPRAGDHVAAREDVGLAGLEGDGVNDDGAVPAALDLGAVQHRAEVHLLAGGRDDAIDGELLEHALALHGLTPAGGVLHSGELHALELQPGHCLLAQDLSRGHQVLELDALGLRLRDLLSRGGHLVGRAAVDYIHVLSAQPYGGTGDIHGGVGAAYDGDVLANFDLLARVHGLEELYAAPDAGLIFTGAAERRALPCAGGEVKRLVSLLAQLRYSDVLADVHAAAELHAHLAQDVNLRLDNVLLKTEGREDAGQHAADLVALLEHRDGVALYGEIIGAGEAGRTAADDGDLIREGLAGLVEHLRHEARLGGQLLVRDELLDVVDGNGVINIAAGAGVLTGPVADAAADRRERVLALYELQRLEIAALGGKLYIALDGDMRGAFHLTWRGAFLSDLAAVGAVINVVLVLAPEAVHGGELRLGGLLLVFRAQLGTELEGAHLAVIHAQAAGHALIALHLGDVVGPEHIRGVEVFAQAQGQAGTAAAVADGGGAVIALGGVYLVDKAVILGALEYLKRLLLADQPVAALLREELGVVVNIHAHIFLEVAAALAHKAPRAAAGAGAYGDGPGSLDYVLDLVIGGCVRVVPNGAADGHRAHGTHARREVRDKYGRAVARIALKALGNDGVFLHLLLDGEHAFHDARHPDGVIVGLDVVVLALVHAADYAALHELVNHGLGVLNARPGLFGYLFYAPRFADLDMHADVGHLIRHDRVEYHVLGVGGRDARIGSRLKAYLRRKEKYLFSEGHMSPLFSLKIWFSNTSCSFIIINFCSPSFNSHLCKLKSQKTVNYHNWF